MGFSLQKVETKELTVDELEALESRSNVTGERPKKKDRLKWMKALFESEQFSRLEWAVCHCKETGKWYRVNGQHSSYMLRCILDGKEPEFGLLPESVKFPEGIPITLQFWECDKEDDLIDVFDQFDQAKSSRTNDEKLNQYAAQHSDLLHIDRKFINKMLAGVDWFRKRDKSNCPEELRDMQTGGAYHRGRLLNVESVRDFINAMHDRKDATFSEWQGKSGMCARFFLTFLKHADTFELQIDNLLYEADEVAQKYTAQVRKQCARTNQDAGHFWKKADSYFREVGKLLKSDEGVKQIKALIRQVLDEDDVEEVAEAKEMVTA